MSDSKQIRSESEWKNKFSGISMHYSISIKLKSQASES